MSREDLIQSALVLGEFSYGLCLSEILDKSLGTALFKAEMKKRIGLVDITYTDAIPHFFNIAEEYNIKIPTMVENYKRELETINE